MNSSQIDVAEKIVKKRVKCAAHGPHPAPTTSKSSLEGFKESVDKLLSGGYCATSRVLAKQSEKDKIKKMLYALRKDDYTEYNKWAESKKKFSNLNSYIWEIKDFVKEHFKQYIIGDYSIITGLVSDTSPSAEFDKQEAERKENARKMNARKAAQIREQVEEIYAHKPATKDKVLKQLNKSIEDNDSASISVMAEKYSEKYNDMSDAQKYLDDTAAEFDKQEAEREEYARQMNARKDMGAEDELAKEIRTQKRVDREKQQMDAEDELAAVIRFVTNENKEKKRVEKEDLAMQIEDALAQKIRKAELKEKKRLAKEQAFKDTEPRRNLARRQISEMYKNQQQKNAITRLSALEQTKNTEGIIQFCDEKQRAYETYLDKKKKEEEKRKEDKVKAMLEEQFKRLEQHKQIKEDMEIDDKQKKLEEEIKDIEAQRIEAEREEAMLKEAASAKAAKKAEKKARQKEKKQKAAEAAVAQLMLPTVDDISHQTERKEQDEFNAKYGDRIKRLEDAAKKYIDTEKDSAIADVVEHLLRSVYLAKENRDVRSLERFEGALMPILQDIYKIEQDDEAKRQEREREVSVSSPIASAKAERNAEQVADNTHKHNVLKKAFKSLKDKKDIMDQDAEDFEENHKHNVKKKVFKALKEAKDIADEERQERERIERRRFVHYDAEDMSRILSTLEKRPTNQFVGMNRASFIDNLSILMYSNDERDMEDVQLIMNKIVNGDYRKEAINEARDILKKHIKSFDDRLQMARMQLLRLRDTELKDFKEGMALPSDIKPKIRKVINMFTTDEKKRDTDSWANFRDLLNNVLGSKGFTFSTNSIGTVNIHYGADVKEAKERLKGKTDNVINNDKAFFSYDIHDIIDIIESKLHITLSDKDRHNLEELIEKETRDIRVKPSLSHGVSAINDVITEIERYINSRKINDKTFKFSEAARFSLKEMLRKYEPHKKEVDNSHGANELMLRLQLLNLC